MNIFLVLIYFVFITSMHEYLTDQQHQAKLEKVVQQFKQLQLKCKSNNLIVNACMNSKCKQALLCNEGQCQHCMKKHSKCIFTSLSGITASLNQGVGRYREFVQRLIQIENTFMNTIQSSRESFIKKYHLGSFESSFQDIINNLYSQGNEKVLNGKQVNDLYFRLQKQNQTTNQKGNLLLDNYQEKLKQIMKKVNNLQEMLFQEYTQEFSSTIIPPNHQKRDEYLSFLRQKLNYPKRFQLIFRGSQSQNNFLASQFHKKCDNIPHTFTLLKTQFGKIIGGYSEYRWNQVNGHVSNYNKNAFLLSFDLKQKTVPKTHQHLIYCNPGYGPTFGGGYDLYISNECNKNNNSYANFPGSYKPQTKQQNKITYTDFTGATNNKKFKVIDYQVFKVIKQ